LKQVWFMANNLSEAWKKRFLRIGHSGAAGLAPANSLASLALALELGVDMVEFDVRPCREALVLLHDDSLARLGQPARRVSLSTLAELHELEIGPGERVATLPEALALLKGRALINIDLKAAGYEGDVLEAVRTYGMEADVLYSTVIPSSLRRLRQLDPQARLGLTYPQDRAGASEKPYLQPLVRSALAAMRWSLPYRILSMMVKAKAETAMLYYPVVTSQTVQIVQGAGKKVFAWTVDSAEQIRRYMDLGVDGITTNRPDLFALL
jgi:glycerophosphoryl diester phosphodiesterase